jgi:hypothetical protein
MKFTNSQIANWYNYETVRASGKWNMWHEGAMVESGLSRQEYLFTLRNYDKLRSAAEAALRSRLSKLRPCHHDHGYCNGACEIEERLQIFLKSA